MMRAVRENTQNERGYVLALSLVIMLFGTLVVGSLLTYVGASVNSRAIARDNLEAYYAADAGIRVIIAKLIQHDYEDPDTGQLAPLPDREYPDEDLSITGVDDILDNEINGHKVVVSVTHGDRSIQNNFFNYEIISSAYAYNPETDQYDLRDKVVAVVSQRPYPIYFNELYRFHADIVSWQRQ